jgi:hypothetical protein
MRLVHATDGKIHVRQSAARSDISDNDIAQNRTMARSGR